MMENEVKRGIQANEENVEAIKGDIDCAMEDCYGAPSYIVVPMLMNVLDTAEKEGRLNVAERRAACDYITEFYGYDF